MRLGLLNGLSLVSLALLVLASSSVFPPWASTTLLTITLLLFKGWLVWAVFDHAELIGIMRGSPPPLSLLPDQGHSSSDLREVQCCDFLLLTHDLGNAIHGGRKLCHNDHGLEMFGDFKTHSGYMS